jgi:hypothetical protein
MNVRRFMVPMLILTAALSTSLGAQAASLGFAGTLGGGYQVEALDIGYMRDVHVGPMRTATIGLRVGAFIDESAIVGGARGVLGALWLSTRSKLVHIADVGSETNPEPFGWDITIEGGGYASTDPPPTQPSPWGAVSILPGLRMGDGPGAHYSLVVGPTVFIGPKTNVRGFLGLRFDIPLARHKSHP